MGPYSITGARLDRFEDAALSAEPASEALVPPHFSACAAHLQAEATVIGERAPKPAQLRSECQTRYRALLQSVLERLISDEWLIGGARELGVPVSEQEAKASVERYRQRSFSGETQFRRFLAGRTFADIVLETRARLASAAIGRALRDSVRPATHEQVASYYAQHRFEYLVAGERNLEIARAKTQASAAEVKREIASGRSFASVVKKLPIPQPVNSDEGIVQELPPHYYGEPKLNRAIFTAAPGVLTGPIGTSFGYFVFEVTKIDLERVKPLRQVEASIRQRLAGPLQERALTAFARRWSATWQALTDCSPGEVVPKCRQFKGVAVAPPEAVPTFG